MDLNLPKQKESSAEKQHFLGLVIWRSKVCVHNLLEYHFWQSGLGLYNKMDLLVPIRIICKTLLSNSFEIWRQILNFSQRGI